MSKNLPEFKTDEDLEVFLEQDDLSEYLTRENFTPVHFEFAPKDKRLSVRVPEELLTAIKNEAAKQGIGYQKYVRQVLAHNLSK